jgi:hypothetical protein
MRITGTPLPITPPATATDEASQPPADGAQTPGSPASESQEPTPLGPRTFETNLDAQMQKARIASLFAPTFQAAPNKAQGAIQALKSPDVGLHAPKADVLSKLTDELKAAVTKAASGKEDDRATVDKILNQIVKAYGIGQNGVTGLEFDPRSTDQGDTIGNTSPKTFITIGKEGLDSPAEAASTILHESNHVRRNKELADQGIDRDKFGMKAENIYSALSEMEGCQLEINNAKKLGTSASYVKGAENLKDHYLHELKVNGAPEDLIALAEKGQFDEAFKKFRQDFLKK